MSRAENIKTKQKPGTKRAALQVAAKTVEKKASPLKVVAKANENARQKSNRAKGHSMVFSYSSADDRNMLDIIDVVRNGIAYIDFVKLADHTPFSMSDWASYLQISERTMQRNQKEKKPFLPIQSERIVELSMLYEYGLEVFGDKSNFDTWLITKSVALGGIAPKELLDTKFGISMVKDALTRIDYRYFLFF